MDQIQRIDLTRVSRQTRRIYGRAAVVAVTGNLMLLVGKGAAAWISGSSAVYADAANSASDVVYSLLMGIGLWLALRPADARHPHGHRRIEPFVSLVIGSMMALAGAQAARSAYRTWVEGAQAITSLWAYAALLGTALVKGGMYLLVKRLAQSAHSSTIAAAARDNLADVISSGMALVGIVASRWVSPLADPLTALAVALWILRSAAGVLREGIAQLIGAAPAPELSHAVEEAARAVPGVLDVHQVILEYVGPQVRADIHVDMCGSLPLDVIHETSDAVRGRIEAMPEIDHAFVHVEPYEGLAPDAE
jgi:cation diffusion facilitator family transporter